MPERPMMFDDGTQVESIDAARLAAIVATMDPSTGIDKAERDALNVLLAEVVGYKSLKVTDLNTKAQAEIAGVAAQKLIKLAKSTFEAGKTRWHEVWKTWTAAEASYVKEAEAVKKHAADEIRGYVAQVREAEEKQRKALQEAEALNSFSLDDAPPSGMNIPMPMVSNEAVAKQSISGAKASVTDRLVPQVDLEKLIIECAKRLERGDKSMLPFLAANEQACRGAVTTYGDKVGDMYPGITAVPHDRVAFRT